MILFLRGSSFGHYSVAEGLTCASFAIGTLIETRAASDFGGGPFLMIILPGDPSGLATTSENRQPFANQQKYTQGVQHTGTQRWQVMTIVGGKQRGQRRQVVVISPYNNAVAGVLFFLRKTNVVDIEITACPRLCFQI